MAPARAPAHAPARWPVTRRMTVGTNTEAASNRVSGTHRKAEPSPTIANITTNTARTMPATRPQPKERLGIKSPLTRRACDTRDGLHVRGHAHVELALQLCLQHLAERPRHDGFQLLVHLVLGPEERLQVLHPLEIRDGHTARVGEDIRDQEDVALAKDRVGLGGGRS